MVPLCFSSEFLLKDCVGCWVRGAGRGQRPMEPVWWFWELLHQRMEARPRVGPAVWMDPEGDGN